MLYLPLLLGIIILLLFILINKQKDSFSVIVNDQTPGGNINVGERYQYPACTGYGCLSSMSGMLKPYFMYDISDDRCANNPLTSYVSPSGLNTIINYQADPNTTVHTSCTGTFNTLYSTINGRYIRITRISGSSGFKINTIAIHTRQYTSLPLASFVYTNTAVTDSTGKIQYPSILTPGQSGNVPGTSIYKTADLTTNYIILDLGANYDIGFIDIIDFGYTTQYSVDGATLEILNDFNTTDLNSEVARVVYYKIIDESTAIKATDLSKAIYYSGFPIITGPYIGGTYGTNFINRRIMMNRVPIPATVTGLPGYTGVVKSIIDTYPNFPCTGCLTDYACTGASGCLIKNYKYNIAGDGRCFKIKTNNVSPATLNAAVTKTLGAFPSAYDAYFMTCSSSTETRISAPVGRYIRLQSNTSNVPIQLYGFYAIGMSSNYLQPLDVHIKPYLVSSTIYYSRLMTSADRSKTDAVISTGSTIGVQSYFQLDLGYDAQGAEMLIKEIIINPYIDSAAKNWISGCTLYVIKTDGTVTYQYVTVDADKLISPFSVYFT